MDPISGLCIGCGRTREEIAAWLSLGETERRAIMRELDSRLVAARSRKSRGRALSRRGG
ncbi:MAG TPA: DUF1289 domain-containing protein [Roseiarcus sp.]|nr:DUF1289 domain-containing protein [Roseiarcus sp.]